MFYKLTRKISPWFILIFTTFIISGKSQALNPKHQPVTFEECAISSLSGDTPELGTLTLGSGKGEPLNACISLDGLATFAHLQVELGSANDFQTHQVQQQAALEVIKLAVESQKDKGAIVRLSSEGPVTDDKIDLVIKLLADGYSHYGQFSIPLLDEFQPGVRLITSNLSQQPAAVLAASAQPQPRHQPRLTIIADIDNTPAEAIAKNTAPTKQNTSGQKAQDRQIEVTQGRYNVQTGDSLSTIAVRLLPEYSQSETLNSLTKKLVALNPKNFINNNINLLRADLDLLLPEKPVLHQNNLATKPDSTVIEAATPKSVYKIVKHDSLSVIAWKLKPAYPEFPTWYKLMEHLIKLNPKAFVKGDINQLRAGKLLRIPSRNNTQVAQLTPDESYPR